MPLDERPVTSLRGVGPALAETLGRLGLHTIQDLLFHLPLRYEDRTRVLPIGSLRTGDRAVIEGEVQLAEVVFRRRRALLCRISDGSGSLTLRFFHFSAAQQEALSRGTRLRCFGEARMGPAGLEIVHPEYRKIVEGSTPPADESLTPVYPTAEGVQQGRMRMLTGLALAQLSDGSLRDWIEPDVLVSARMPALESSLRYVHRPPPSAGHRAAELGPAPGPATSRLRGAARAPDQPEDAAPGGGPRRCLAVAAQRGPRRALPRATAFPADRCATAHVARDRGGHRPRAADDATRAGRRRARARPSSLHLQRCALSKAARRPR